MCLNRGQSELCDEILHNFLKMEATSLAGFELQCREIWSADREKKTEAEAMRRLQRGGSGLPWLVRWQRAARMETASPEAVRSTRQSNRTERKITNPLR